MPTSKEKGEKMSYIILGRKKGKKYTSRKTFTTEKAARKYAYELVYNPSGDTKRKHGLTNWRIKKK